MNWHFSYTKDAEKQISILWKHMLMMLSILALALIALLINNKQSLKTLTKEHLTKYQIAFEQDCSALSSTMYATIAIPDGIEGTRYYDYIKSAQDGQLDIKYYPVLNYLRKALNNQVYLRDSSETCLLYMSGCNSIVTNEKNFPKAEDCFDQYIAFSETGSETLLGYLKDRDVVMLLCSRQKSGQKAMNAACRSLFIPEKARSL